MNTKELIIGQEVAITSGGSRMETYFGYRVKRVTPTGQVTVVRPSDGYERRFDASGFEMGTHSRYGRDQITTHIEAERELQRSRTAAVAAANAINAIGVHVQHRWGKESLQNTINELEQKLAAAKALVEAI